MSRVFCRRRRSIVTFAAYALRSVLWQRSVINLLTAAIAVHLCLWPVPGTAQMETGIVWGNLVDPSGSLVPRVEVHAKHDRSAELGC